MHLKKQHFFTNSILKRYKIRRLWLIVSTLRAIHRCGCWEWWTSKNLQILWVSASPCGSHKCAISHACFFRPTSSIVCEAKCPIYRLFYAKCPILTLILYFIAFIIKYKNLKKGRLPKSAYTVLKTNEKRKIYDILHRTSWKLTEGVIFQKKIPYWKRRN